MKHRRKLLRGGVYLLYLVVATVAGTELILRVFSLAPTDGVFTATQAEFERVPGIFSPNRSIVDTRRRGLEHRVTIDSLGYRGSSFPRQRALGELRVVMVGDSFTWGDFVDDDDTLPAQLEELLSPSCARLTVVNAGVPSTTISAQVELALRSLVLDPQLVVLVFFDNDLTDLLDPNIWEMTKENRIAKSRFPLSVAYPVLRRTALWNMALDVRRRMLIGRQSLIRAAQEDRASVSGREEEAKPTYREYLATLNDTLRRRGIPLVLVSYPATGSRHSGEAAGVGEWALDAAGALGIHTVNVGPTLWSSGLTDTELFLLPLDGHPSPRGYRVAAGALADALRTVPVVQDLCRS